MKEIYKKILKKALPYYENGREGDVEHIKWIFETLPKLVNESDIDFDILIPVVILHDIGYARVPKGSNPFNLDIRKLHSKEGSLIAQEILQELDYSTNTIDEIKKFILKHDNWAFGDSFEDEPILRIFNNFDFMWMASEKGFHIARKFLKMEPKDFFEQIKVFQRKNEEEGREWFNEKIEKYYHKLMEERQRELFKKKEE